MNSLSGSGAPPALIAEDSPASAAETLEVDASPTPRDTAVYLLHIGAEIEQMLMVQSQSEARPWPGWGRTRVTK